MKNISPFLALAVFAIFLILQACNEDDGPGSLQLRLKEKVGGAELVFDNIQYSCTAGHTFSVITLRYYLSRVHLVGEDGSRTDLAEYHYRDAREPSTATIFNSTLPDGRYNALEFVFGLDGEMNVDGGLPNTIENINMEWPIPGDQGYHYMKFEGKYAVYNTEVINSFNLHTGATGGNQNFISVSLPLSPLIIKGDNWTLDIQLDLLEWLQNPNTYDFEVFGPAIMMNQEAQLILKQNGSTVFSVGSAIKQ